MGIKKKVMGILAATALTLSMFGGVAANGSADVNGSVKLIEGICKVSIAPSTVSFGTWTYQGNGYAHTGGHNSVTLNGTMTAGQPDGKCDVTATTNGLSASGATIGANHFTGSINGSNPQNLANHDIADGSMTVTGLSAGSAEVEITLVSVPADYEVGTYSGTLNVSVVNAN